MLIYTSIQKFGVSEFFCFFLNNQYYIFSKDALKWPKEISSKDIYKVTNLYIRLKIVLIQFTKES